VFQPSVFGILLICSVFFFLENRPFWAVSLLGAAVSVHPSYLVTAASLTLAYMIVIGHEEKSYWVPIRLGLCSLFFAVPVLAYTLYEFGSASAEAAYDARRILVEYRIPHHAKVEEWFDGGSGLKIAMLMFALWLHRRNRVFFVLFVPFAVGTVLTLIQVATESYFLALLFPWRVSALLVPVSTALLFASASHYVVAKIERTQSTVRNWLDPLLVGLAVVALLGGLAISLRKMYPAAADKEYRTLVEHVTREAREEDVFVVPASWQKFRIESGVPILVDHKTAPYKDVEVLEWYARRQLLDEIYMESYGQCEKVGLAAETYGVTKIVFKSEGRTPSCPMFEQTFSNGVYEVHDIRGESI
jgi:uncharacterized protein YbaR (Trm112 family)